MSYEDDARERRKSDPGRPRPPSRAQENVLSVLRQRLKDGEITFPEYLAQAHGVLECAKQEAPVWDCSHTLKGAADPPPTEMEASSAPRFAFIDAGANPPGAYRFDILLAYQDGSVPVPLWAVRVETWEPMLLDSSSVQRWLWLLDLEGQRERNEAIALEARARMLLATYVGRERS
jgi:hypothetical protein